MNEDPTPVLGAGIAIFGVVVLLIAANFWRNQRKEAARQLEEEKKQQFRDAAREFMRDVKANGGLRTLPTTVILKSGESAYCDAPAHLLETRAVRHYASTGQRVRVMKRISVGSSSGRSYSTQEWTRIAAGTLTITNKRLIFTSLSESRAFPISRILSADCGTDCVEVAVEGRQKSMLFRVGMNPLILASVIRICCAFEDPAKIDPQKIEITYV